MNEFLYFLEIYETWFYILFGIVGLVYLRKVFVAWRDWRAAIFGLERETAIRRLSAALTVLILTILLGLAEFLVVSFVAPSVTQLKFLATPTLDLLTTPTITLAPLAAAAGTAQPAAAGSPAPASATGCTQGQIEWVEPTPGQEIQGAITLKGTVNAPNFGYYKYEFSQPGSDNWTTIAAGNEIKVNGDLGVWNTSQMTNGDYLLRLIVFDNQNNMSQPCVVSVRILAP